jgi:hypothetical protein
VACRQAENGQLLLGNWWHPPLGEDDGSLNPAYEGLREFAARYFPELFVKATQRWPGLGGLTPDRLPLVGSLPDVPRAYYAVGLGVRGLAWSYVLAERVTELLLHQVDPGLLSGARLAPPEAAPQPVESTPDLAILDPGPPPDDAAPDLTGTGEEPEEGMLDLADLALLDIDVDVGIEAVAIDTDALTFLEAGLPPAEETLDLADLAFVESGALLEDDALILRDLAFLETADPSEEQPPDLADLDLTDASLALEEDKLDPADLAFLETGVWPEETADELGDASLGEESLNWDDLPSAE